MISAVSFSMDTVHSGTFACEELRPPCAVRSHEVAQCRKAIEDIILARCRGVFASCRVLGVDVNVPLERCNKVHSCTYDVALHLGDSVNLGQAGASALRTVEVMFCDGLANTCAGGGMESNFLRGLTLKDSKISYSYRSGDQWVIQLQFALITQSG